MLHCHCCFGFRANNQVHSQGFHCRPAEFGDLQADLLLLERVDIEMDSLKIGLKHFSELEKFLFDTIRRSKCVNYNTNELIL